MQWLTESSGSNPFARKPAANANRNPFDRSADVNKSLHKSESFFTKVDAAEAEKGKRAYLPAFVSVVVFAQPDDPGPAKGKGKEKKEVGRQTTLFGLPPVQPTDKKAAAAGRKKKAGTPAEESQESASKASAAQESQSDTQADVAMDESQAETVAGGDTQVVDEEATQLVETQGDDMDEVSGVPRRLTMVAWLTSDGRRNSSSGPTLQSLDGERSNRRWMRIEATGLWDLCIPWDNLLQLGASVWHSNSP